MGNCCSLYITIVGKKDNVLQACKEKLYPIVDGTMINNEQYLNLKTIEINTGVDPAKSLKPISKIEDIYAYTFLATCNWSIETALVKCSEHLTLQKLSSLYNIGIEAYSSEPGFYFQEHYIAFDGEIQLSDCVPYFKIHIESIDFNKFNSYDDDKDKIEYLKSIYGKFLIMMIKEDYFSLEEFISSYEIAMIDNSDFIEIGGFDSKDFELHNKYEYYFEA